jgi:hypothetical protein
MGGKDKGSPASSGVWLLVDHDRAGVPGEGTDGTCDEIEQVKCHPRRCAAEGPIRGGSGLPSVPRVLPDPGGGKYDGKSEVMFECCSPRPVTTLRFPKPFGPNTTGDGLEIND